MRYTSIKLYGELCSKTKEFEIAVDMSLHHNNVVTFLMHLCEDNKDIVQVSIYNLYLYFKLPYSVNTGNYIILLAKQC